MAYPSAADIENWYQHVDPVGVRDDRLWAFAYAAMGGDMSLGAATDPTGLNAFHAFQTRVWNIVNSLNYWDGDFVLAFIQATGQWPSLPAFTTWLAANGYARLNPDGKSYAKTGAYPYGGTGYPPNGGQVAGSPAPTSVTPAPASGSTGAVASTASPSGILATLEAHPLELAIGGGVLLLLLMRR